MATYEDNKLIVAYAADDHYAKFFGISIISLFKTNKTFKEIYIYLLDCGITDDNLAKINSIIKDYKGTLHIIKVKDIEKNLDLNMGNRKIAIASYARLFLEDIIPSHINRILYIDCDTIINANLGRLWTKDLDKYHIAGVIDTVDSFFLKKINLSKEEYYVNAGILLINLKRWRKERLYKNFIAFINKNLGNVPHHDQGVINAICKDKKIISPKYNVTSNLYSFKSKSIKRMYYLKDFYSQKSLDYAKENPVIIHYTTGIYGRPWEESCIHPMKDVYIKYFKISPWNKDVLDKDSRSKSVKIFSFLYRYMPKFIIENIYKYTIRLTYYKER